MSKDLNGQEYINVPKSEYINLCNQVQELNDQLTTLRRMIFGKSSEKTSSFKNENANQISMFEGLSKDTTNVEDVEEPKNTEVAAHKRKKRTAKDTIPEDLPVEVVEHTLPSEELVCDTCGTQMSIIGKESHKELVIVPARVYVREDVYYKYACPTCKTNATDVAIKEAKRIPSVIPSSYASPEAISYIANQKFCMDVPLYRLEKNFFKVNGIELTRQTMSNWLISACSTWLMPLHKRLREKLLANDIIHADETTLQVLHENGKSATSKSYVWLYRTGKYANMPIVFYEYRENRGGQNVRDFLSEYEGYVHTDGYEAYHTLNNNITVVGCWAHLRRKFNDAVETVKRDKRPSCLAAKGLSYCNKLFAIEKKIENLSPEEKFLERQKQAIPIIEAFEEWIEKNKNAIAPKSALGKAMVYADRQWPYLINYVKDGRLEISNNLAERSIKPFVMGRKNFLFANSVKGAECAPTMYSIIETAKENRLDPFKYMLWILSNAPSADQSTDWEEDFMPNMAPDECKI